MLRIYRTCTHKKSKRLSFSRCAVTQSFNLPVAMENLADISEPQVSPNEQKDQ